MKRRHFLRAGTATAALSLSQKALTAPGEVAPTEEIIDLHQHINYSGRLDEAFLLHQKKMGITRTVLLPSARAMDRPSTHGGKSNGLAARIFGNEANARFAAAHPESYVFFCNAVPDSDDAKAELEGWLKKGAVGIGEQKFGLDCDSKPMRLVYDIAKEFEVPVLLHFQHQKYNMGYERFGKILEAYPTVNFIGHAQTFWGHVDAKHDPKVLYPKGKVTKGGLTDRYLADHANLFGDLSAGSGKNSISRDLEHGAGFLERHQDKLCYGTDCSDKIGEGAGCIGAVTQSLIRRLLPNKEAQTKLFSGNAKQVVKFPEAKKAGE